MPIKVFFKEEGPFALVDTLEEAATLMKMGTPGTINLEVAAQTGLTESEAIKTFWKEINNNAKNFVRYVLLHPDGVKGEKLTEQLNIPAEKFGGIMGGASKIAGKFGIAWNQLIISELKAEGALRYRWLQPGTLLLKYKQEILGTEARTPGKVTTMGA